MGKVSKIVICVVFACLILLAFFCAMFFWLFKTEYKDIVFESAKQNNISSSLVFAVIKAESKFNKDAKSKANAIGLMQVKLTTANYMLSLENKSEILEKELFIPKNNIEIGTKYLKYLFDKFDNEQVVICAYNAGETVVNEWLKNKTYSQDGKTLQKIPFEETKNYLSKVLHNKKIYQKIFKFD